jgi:hypothetical protein
MDANADRLPEDDLLLSQCVRDIIFIDSSEEIVGDLGLGQFRK